MANLKEDCDARTALLWFKPERLKIKPGLNGRDLTSPDNIAHIEDTAASIAANGFMQSKPIEIFSEGEDIFISDGHIRLAAVQLCASRGVFVEKVPCVPEARGTNDADRILNQSAHNSGKRFSPIEEGRNLKRAIALGRTVAEVAAKIGKSLTYVNQAIDFQAAPAEVHALVSSGAISATLAAKTIRREGNTAGAETIKAAVAEAKAAGKTKATEKHVAPLVPPARTDKGKESKQVFLAPGSPAPQPSDGDRAANLSAAISYALDVADDGLEWLRAWREGEASALSKLATHLGRAA